MTAIIGLLDAINNLPAAEGNAAMLASQLAVAALLVLQYFLWRSIKSRRGNRLAVTGGVVVAVVATITAGCFVVAYYRWRGYILPDFPYGPIQYENHEVVSLVVWPMIVYACLNLYCYYHWLRWSHHRRVAEATPR